MKSATLDLVLLFAMSMHCMTIALGKNICLGAWDDSSLQVYLVRGYFGSLGCLRVLGRWKVTLNLVFLCFFHVPFLVAFKAFCAFALLSLPVTSREKLNHRREDHHRAPNLLLLYG